MTAGDEAGQDQSLNERVARVEQRAVVEALGDVPDRLAAMVSPPSGSLLDLYEKHLSDAVQASLRERTGEPVASRRVPVEQWSSKGAVDVVLPAYEDGQRPQHVMELKWCRDHDKTWEAIWDLFKLGLLCRLGSVQTAHLVTGAPVEMWHTALCRDIFEGGTFYPEELCQRKFSRSIRGKTAWHYLLEGGHGHFPRSVPTPIEAHRVGSWEVVSGDLTWEIRAVSVHAGPGEVPFYDGWPNGRAPASARRPAESAGKEAPSDLAEFAPGSEGSKPPAFLGPRFEEAVSLARTLHFGHARKGTRIVYLSHLLAVAALVLEDGGDEDEAIAALLHDTVEDQGGVRRLDQIRQLFGDRVADIVDGCTDTHVEPKPPWRERKERYLKHLRHTDRYDVLRVSLADKLHNARAIVSDLREQGPELWSRFTTGSAEDQLWYYGELARAFEARRPGRMTDELRRAVEEMKRLTTSEPADRSP